MYKKFSGVEFEVSGAISKSCIMFIRARLIFNENMANLYTKTRIKDEDSVYDDTIRENEYENEEDWMWVCGFPYYQTTLGKLYTESELVEVAKKYVEDFIV